MKLKKKKKKIRHPKSTFKGAERQIRGGIDENSKIIFLFLNENLCCDPSSEPSRRDGSNDGPEFMF